MRTAPVTLAILAASCGVLPAEVPALPPPPALAVTASPLYAGFEGEVRVSGLDPGGRLTLALSVAGPGGGPCPPSLGGACLGLQNPFVVAERTAGPGGASTTRARIPRDARPTLWLQAVGRAGGQIALSPVVRLDIVPWGTDTDADGLQDGLELERGTDPRVADTDGDGLDDGREVALGSSPLLPDTDGDGLTDGDEVDLHGSSPRSSDSDGDGVGDLLEVTRGMDPASGDTDGDGQPDGDDLFPTVPDVPDPWVAIDREASSRSASVHDPEFDETTGKVVWQPVNGGSLWVARLERSTGDLVPSDGKGVRVDTDVAPLTVGFNGAEWMVDATGSQIVYPKRDQGELVLWRAKEIGGVWRTGMMPGRTPGVVPLGSKDPTEARGRVTFNRGGEADPQPYWREVEEPGTTTALPVELASIDPRWMQNGERVLAGTAPRGPQGWRQAWVYDIDTEEVVWVTSDASHKYEPWVTRAPDLGGNRVMAVLRGAVEGDYTEVVLLQETGPGTWDELGVLPTPAKHPFAVSPEVFIAEGRAWVTWQASLEPQWFATSEGSIWLASVDPTVGVLRRISRTGPMVRKDPEPFTAGARPWVYYTEVTLPDKRRILHRCELGLPP